MCLAGTAGTGLTVLYASGAFLVVLDVLAVLDDLAVLYDLAVACDLDVL
jgi:hypothetical protein